MSEERPRIELTPAQARILQSIAEGRCPLDRVQEIVRRFGFKRLVLAMLDGIDMGRIPVGNINTFSEKGLPQGVISVASGIFNGKTSEEIIAQQGINSGTLSEYRKIAFGRSGAENDLQFAAQMGKTFKKIGTLRYHLANMRR